jgi:hypothetical protein
MAFDESPVEVLHYNMKDLRAVEILETQLTGNVEPFLDAISALPPSVAIFGGGADTDDLNQPSYIFDKEAIMNEGFVIMLFRGTVKVLTRSVLGWQPLGRQVTITAMDGNMVIKELDHIAVNFYEKYLKIDPSVDFDKKTLSFSLVVEKDGVELARLPMSCRKDGSLVFNIALHVGDKLRMAYGNPNENHQWQPQSLRPHPRLRTAGHAPLLLRRQKILSERRRQPDPECLRKNHACCRWLHQR